MFWSKKRFFTASEEQRIVVAIQEAERHTSGEIRVHVHRNIWQHLMADAVEVFHDLGMDATAQSNGVLFFLVPKTRQFAIIADKGINDVVPADFWDCIKADLEAGFRQGHFVEPLLQAIATTGQELKAHFPHEGDDDINELPDTISYE